MKTNKLLSTNIELTNKSSVEFSGADIYQQVINGEDFREDARFVLKNFRDGVYYCIATEKLDDDKNFKNFEKVSCINIEYLTDNQLKIRRYPIYDTSIDYGLVFKNANVSMDISTLENLKYSDGQLRLMSTNDDVLPMFLPYVDYYINENGETVGFDMYFIYLDEAEDYFENHSQGLKKVNGKYSKLTDLGLEIAIKDDELCVKTERGLLVVEKDYLIDCFNNELVMFPYELNKISLSNNEEK